MIIHPDKYGAYVCPLSMSAGSTEVSNCLGPKCMAWKELSSIPDENVILEEKVQGYSPSSEWRFVPAKSLGLGKGYAPFKYVKYKMIPRATCGMITKDEVYVNE